MGRDIAILGGGIAGMSAAILLVDKVEGCDITIYSKDLGGEYLSGGLKYLHATPAMLDFVMNRMRMGVHLEKVNGAVYWDGEIWQHPEWFWYLASEAATEHHADEIQRQYALKTRGADAIFKHTCMNDPWTYRNEVKLVPNGGGIPSLIKNMEAHIRHHDRIRTKIVDVDEELLERLISEYNYVIYTIPIQFLGKLLCFQAEFEYRPLNIIRYFVIDGDWPIWMDYIYVPSDEFRFHRMSFFKIGLQKVIDVETNGQFEGDELDEIIDCDIPSFIRRAFPSLNFAHQHNHRLSVKGQLKSDSKTFQIPEHIFLLGRYAQWDSRVTFDKVLGRAAKISERIGTIEEMKR